MTVSEPSSLRSSRGSASGALHRPLCPEGRSARDVVETSTSACRAEARPYVLAATILGSAMAFIDSTVVTIALPALQDDLSASFGGVQWVVNAYALMLGTLILLGGAAGDTYGQRRLFIIGINVFALASVFCATAPNTETLIAARALQGIGAALLVPQSLALIATHFPKEERGRAIGIWAGASAITTALGPPLGGLMIDWADWRAVFWINFPVSLGVIYLAHRYIPEDAPREISKGPDWMGGVLALAGFGGLTVGLTWAAEGTLGTMNAIVMGIGVVALAVFWHVERRHDAPLMPTGLFNDRTFLAANLMTLFLYGALAIVLFLVPFDLIERRQFSASEVGLILLPFGLIIGVVSRFAGQWADHSGPRLPLALGSSLVAAAAVFLALAIDSVWVGVLAPIILMAFGMALVVSPLTTAVMNAAPDAQSGAASGINNAASRIAGLLAIVVAGIVANYVFVNELTVLGLGPSAFADANLHMGDLPPPEAAAWQVAEFAFRRAYAAGMGIAAAAAILSAVIAFFSLPAKTAIADRQST